MTGDGLSDIVRIRNGEICYWPNRGYGRFGAKVEMDRSPWFDEPTCSTRRGSGSPTPTGLARPISSISAATGSRFISTRAGNSWSRRSQARAGSDRRRPRFDHRRRPPRPRHGLPASGRRRCPATPGGSCAIVDLMCGQQAAPARAYDNNLGAETRIDYASSTEFYLADKAAGTPWVTRLPFPVHVVETRRDLRLHQPQPLRHALQLSPRLSTTASSASSAASAGSTSSTPRTFAALTQRERFPRRRQYRRRLERAAGADQDLVSTPGSFSRRPHLAASGARILPGGRGASRRGRARSRADPSDAARRHDPAGAARLRKKRARPAGRSRGRRCGRRSTGSTAPKPPIGRIGLPKATSRSARLQHDVGQIGTPSSSRMRARRSASTTSASCTRSWDAAARIRASSHAVTLAVDDYGNVLKSVAIGYGRRFPRPVAAADRHRSRTAGSASC